MKNQTIKKCLAEIYFPDRHFHLTYFNDEFPLEVGDLVYVEGKMEGIPGRVEKLTYRFKIRRSDYKKVIALVDTRVKGQLYLAGDSIFTLEETVLPYEKVSAWFLPPLTGEKEVFCSSQKEERFLSLEEFKKEIPPEIWERGEEYFEEERVFYAELAGDKLRAIVMGNRPYEVEFDFWEDKISDPLCDCFCPNCCKHQVAALLQLKETLKEIKEEYNDDLSDLDYVAVMPKFLFYRFVLEKRKSYGIKLD